LRSYVVCGGDPPPPPPPPHALSTAATNAQARTANLVWDIFPSLWTRANDSLCQHRFPKLGELLERLSFSAPVTASLSLLPSSRFFARSPDHVPSGRQTRASSGSPCRNCPFLRHDSRLRRPCAPRERGTVPNSRGSDPSASKRAARLKNPWAPRVIPPPPPACGLVVKQARPGVGPSSLEGIGRFLSRRTRFVGHWNKGDDPVDLRVVRLARARWQLASVLVPWEAPR